MPDPIVPATPPPQPSVTRMYGAVMGVGIACAVVIVAVYETTKPIIDRNRAEMREQAIFDVLPAARTTAAFRRDSDGRLERVAADESGGDIVFAGFDDQHHLAGLAIEARGMGYQDVVTVLYGYSFERQAIIGLRVLESRETPGLGDRVETDAAFVKNFECLDVRLNSRGDGLAHLIEFVKPGQKEAAWQIDGISGATITSQAIARMLRESTAVWIPRVNQQRPVFVEKQDQESRATSLPSADRVESAEKDARSRFSARSTDHDN